MDINELWQRLEREGEGEVRLKHYHNKAARHYVASPASRRLFV